MKEITDSLLANALGHQVLFASSTTKIWVPVIVAAVLIAIFVGLGFYSKKHSESLSVRFMSRVAIFTAMATILYVVPIFQFKLPFFPSFLEIHLDEIPSMIAGFAYGPLVAMATVFLKTLIKLPFTSTMLVGELTDFLLGLAYVGLSSFIFSKKKDFWGAVIGISVGTVTQVALAMILNVYVMIPFYTTLMGLSEEMLLGLMQAAIPAISDVEWSYALFAVLPFNLLKDAIVIVVTLACYRMLAMVLKKMQRTAEAERLAAKAQKEEPPKKE